MKLDEMEVQTKGATLQRSMRIKVTSKTRQNPSTMPSNAEMPLQANKHQKHPKSTIYVDVMPSTCGMLRSER
jgi:hypothetical protein